MIFPPAQENPPALLVPHVWAMMSTLSATAQKAPCGTVQIHLHYAMPTMDWSPNLTNLHSASTGNFPEAATALIMNNVTFALDVVKPLMELKPVIKLRKFKALTPYKPNTWEKYLHDANLLQEHEHILTGLCLSFHLDFPEILQTQTPLNHNSTRQYKTHSMKVIHNEIQTSRYIGPTSKAMIETLIGPFQYSPMSIIPRALQSKYV